MNQYRLKDDNVQVTAQQLLELMDTVPDQLRKISPENFSKKPAPDKWSPKEIIGHLLDSATNNHHRFVRAQFDDKPQISYDQDLWNKHSYYLSMEGEGLISFWEMYNRHLATLIRQIPSSLMERECLMGDGSTHTIAWLFDDYVRHLEHHLHQIFHLNLSIRQTL